MRAPFEGDCGIEVAGDQKVTATVPGGSTPPPIKGKSTSYVSSIELDKNDKI